MPFTRATGENFYVDACISFWVPPHIQITLNQTGAGIEKSVMVEANKMKNSVGNTDTKEQMLKEPFKLLQGKFSGWGCLEKNSTEYLFICSQDI